MDDVGVWVNGECVGFVRYDGRQSIDWPIAAPQSIAFGATVSIPDAWDFQVARCRRENYATPMRGGVWTTTVVFVDGERSKVAIINGLAALRAVYGFADGH